MIVLNNCCRSAKIKRELSETLKKLKIGMAHEERSDVD